LPYIGNCGAPDRALEKNGELVMNLPSKILATALLAASPAWLAGSAAAAPIGASLGLHNAGTPAVQTVAWRGGWGWGGRGWGGRGWGWGGAAAGLAAGAVIGGAVAASGPGYGYDYDYGPGYSYGYDPYYSYGPSYSYGYSDPYYSYAPGYSSYGPGYGSYGSSVAPDQSATAYCQQRFRSYDPATGTYLGYDGIRHSCP
jgi:hypothetical protein